MTLLSKENFQVKVVTLAVLVAQTFSLAPYAVLADGAGGSVRLAGQTIFVNKASDGATSVDGRTTTIQHNLDNALVAATDRSADSVKIVYVKGMPVITLGGYEVVTVDGTNAKDAGVTPAVLAQRWADSLRHALTDSSSITSYVGQLTGGASSGPAVSSAPAYQRYNGNANYNQAAAGDNYNQGGGNAQYGNNQYQANGQAQGGYNQYQANGQAQGGYNQYQPNGGQGYQRGRVTYAPAGLNFSATLSTAIATQVAKPGDLIQAQISQGVALADGGSIPAGSTVIGQITEAKSGGFLTKSGAVSIKFNRLRTPDGVETPISAHLVGGIGKYSAGANGDTIEGETAKNKVESAGIRGLLGAGAGAALGTAVGAIAGGGHGAGRGAWSGTAIGGGAGLADSLLLRKGKDVTIPSGQQLQLQLDQPVTISGAMNNQMQ
jgi:hypothetical protein